MVTRAPWKASLSVGLFGLAVAIGATLVTGGVPAPRVADEFSYLLAADTYAHGRFTNPTHPFWQHFETFHEIQQPTYASKYPPASGLVMAFGQVVSGNPIVGIWLGYAMMGAALTWMLLGWTRPSWALWGGALACLWLVGVQAYTGPQAAYWATSYWGGTTAAAGGALLFGAVRRIMLRPAVGPALIGALGLGLLANSRPAEGLLVSIVPLAVLVRWFVSAGREHRMVRLRRVVLPLLSGLLVVGALMGCYNYRVTGSPWTMPYMVYEATYGTVQPFLWQTARPTPAYHHEDMRLAYTTPSWFTPLPVRTVHDFLVHAREGARRLIRFFVPIEMVLLLLMIPWVLRARWTWLAAAGVATVGLGLMAETWNLPHYAAPAVGPMLILLVEGARHLRTIRLAGIRWGPWLVRGVLVCAAGSAALSGARSYQSRGAMALDWLSQRQAMIRVLSAQPARHLVIVSYGPRHRTISQWVYNAADIDGAPVVWARSLGEARDRSLRTYFAGRTAWRLVVDDDHGPFTLQRLDP